MSRLGDRCQPLALASPTWWQKQRGRWWAGSETAASRCHWQCPRGDRGAAGGLARRQVPATATASAHVVTEGPLVVVSPLAVPLLVMIGRESVAQGSVDDALLLEAESLASVAMTP